MPRSPDGQAGSDAVPPIVFEHVSRRYGEVRAVDAVDLSVQAGEFFAMLGPSGSGKTTCLRLMAGFERPSSGTVRLFGEDAAELPPWHRALNTVFQDYALFPHLSVVDNVAYGPMIRGVPKAERRGRARELLELVGLPDHGQRRPAALSGGQRQRVALARALINEPRVLLLDEPLGALDLKLRERMQEELKTLQRSLGITFVFVTHDQGEALSMADRVAVFDTGRLVQVGTPQAVYTRPATPFVADFVGSSNVLEPEVAERFGLGRRWISLRPEAIGLRAAGDGYAARLVSRAFAGATTRLVAESEGRTLRVDVPAGTALPEDGATVHLGWDAQAAHPMEAR